MEAQTLAAFLVPENGIAPFEFRSLTIADKSNLIPESMPGEYGGNGNSYNSPGTQLYGRAEKAQAKVLERASREAIIGSAIEAARQEGLQTGDQEGRRAAKAELEVQMNLALAQERQRLVDAVNQFRVARDRYFAEIEQEVVKLALAIAARVLHREAQIDPLLLTGVVRVALEKMADRSGVVLRVAGTDVEAWERIFHATEASERPRVAEDARLERGECVLETKMGTVELGVHVQLEEIEKGFFDLLNHRPVQ